MDDVKGLTAVDTRTAADFRSLKDFRPPETARALTAGERSAE